MHSGQRDGPVIPRQLLPPPTPFANRVRELADLNTALAEQDPSAPAVVILRGPGGVGKTALALRWLSDLVDRFSDGQLYADLALSTGEPVAPEDVLGQFLRALGVAPQHVPPGFAERTALYRSVTARSAMIVLLDNAASAAQTRVLLPASPRSLAVVTSRRPLLGLLAVGARSVAVDPLGREDAIELLSYGVGAQRVDVEREAAARLAELCGGLPIALCVAAARAATRPRWPLTRMVDELSDEQERLDALSTEGDLSVRSTFDVAYAGLPDSQQRMYRTLGLHPGPSFSVEAVAAATGTDVRSTRRALEDLVDASLVEDLAFDRYRLHDLVRLHAHQQALAQDEDDRQATIRRTLEWYLFTAQVADHMVMPARRVLGYHFADAGFLAPATVGEPAGAVDWLERQRPNLIAATYDAAKHDWVELAYHLADALQPLYIMQGHHREAIEIDETGLRAATAWGDRKAEYSMRKRLARKYYHFGLVDRAEEHATILLSQARADRNQRVEASALKIIALTRTAAGDLAGAAGLFREALLILRALGKRRSEGLTLIDLGATLHGIGAVDEAIAELSLAREILATLNPPDRYNAARAAVALGVACLDVARHDAARGLLEDAVAVLAEPHADRERANAHDALADLSERTGDEEGARQHRGIAEALRRPVTVSDVTG